jgi:hypothetical protein
VATALCADKLLGIPITSSDFWQSEDECTLESLRHVFRSTTEEEIPMLEERLACLREAGQVLYEVYAYHRHAPRTYPHTSTQY